MTSDVSNISSIPQDIQLEIFKTLDERTLRICCQVCKNWNTTITQTNELWRSYAEQKFKSLPSDKPTKTYLNEQFQNKPGSRFQNFLSIALTVLDRLVSDSLSAMESGTHH